MAAFLRTAVAVLAVMLVGVVLAGCAPGKSKDEKGGGGGAEKSPTPGSSGQSMLVLDGKHVDKDGRRVADPVGEESPAKQAPAKRATPVVEDEVDEWPEPKLLADGSIDDGPDPFLGTRIQPLPLPIEDDPRTTKAIDLWSSRIRRVDRTQWDDWMAAGLRSPWSQDTDAAMASIVKVTVERCGGARTVATGVVLDEETVVTTVHAIESPARRVRVSQAQGDAPRLPAMVRYLDVDDDIAVLKVPGLAAPPMLFHVITGDEPQWGYAYGIGQGGQAGVLRRAPSVVAMQEAVIDVEQPDGFAEQISDRSVLPMVGAVDTGFSGGVVTATNDPLFVSSWGFHGLIRARVPFRADTGGIVIPARLVGDALNANDLLDEWYEHPAGRCPQWTR